VTPDREAGWGQTIEPSGASGDIEHAPAVLAMEVMMVARRCGPTLVSGWLAGDGDRDGKPLIEEGVQRPVDGRYAQAGDMHAGRG
jgi:hypothetical protein